MAFLYGSCGAARTEAVVGRWCVQLAAVCYWYLPLRICVMCFIVSVHSFSVLFSNLVSVNETEWMTISARPRVISYMIFFNLFFKHGQDGRGNLGLCTCMFCFCVRVGIDSVCFDTRKGYYSLPADPRYTPSLARFDGIEFSERVLVCVFGWAMGD